MNPRTQSELHEGVSRAGCEAGPGDGLSQLEAGRRLSLSNKTLGKLGTGGTKRAS